MRKVCMAGAAILFAAVTTASGGARQISSAQNGQSSGQTSPQTSRPSILEPDSPNEPAKQRMEEQASRSRNSERHKRLVADTDKLLQLSTELKSEVDETTKDELSIKVIQKAAEIEKLAHDVKERMKS